MRFALVYSAWGDFIRALSFDAGWWSVGTWIAGVTAFAATAALGAKARSELILGGVFIAGPIAAVALFGLLKQFADPEPGCT